MTDDDLRQLFHDATADIRPQRTLDDIRSQTKKVDPVARQWFVPSLAAAAAMALVIGGAFWVTQDDGDGGGSLAAAAPPSPIPATVYYAGAAAQGERLFSEIRTVQEIGPADDRGPDPEEVATLAIDGPPTDPDYRSLWPAGVTVSDVGFSGESTITVSLDGPAGERPADMTEDQARLAANAVARTLLDAFPDADQVQFPGGVLGLDEDTFDGGSDDDVLALVSISELLDGATVPAGKLTVTGMASAFEANVVWEILVGGDAVIDSGFATAAECCTLSPFTFTTNIALEGPGAYTLVVQDVDESGEGRPVNRDTKEIVVE